VTFYLADEPEVISERLRTRRELSRLELTGSPGRELELYGKAYNFLRRHDWEQEKIDCRGRTPERVVAPILKRLDRYAK
jgi:dTMP kinase